MLSACFLTSETLVVTLSIPAAKVAPWEAARAGDAARRATRVESLNCILIQWKWFQKTLVLGGYNTYRTG